LREEIYFFIPKDELKTTISIVSYHQNLSNIIFVFLNTFPFAGASLQLVPYHQNLSNIIFVSLNTIHKIHDSVAGASLQLVPYHQNIDNFIFVFMLAFLKIRASDKRNQRIKKGLIILPTLSATILLTPFPLS
jgi:hypothetical protein